jgi:Aspartyl protease
MPLRVLATAPITFDGADGSTGHAPLVAGAVGGIDTLLVLDTGSDVHILTKELVDELGLDVEEGEEGVDHSGATMPSWSVTDVSLGLGGAALTLRDLVSIPAPGPFPAKGIGGILSPQHLHPTAVVVIDLAADELLLAEGDDDEVTAWLAERSPSLETLSLPRDPAFTSIVVSAAVRPFAELPTLLNTGGKRTEFARAAVPGLGDGSSERLGGGVSGADVIGSSGGAQVIAIAGHDVPVEQLAVRETMHDPQGMVGADVLRGTVLACAADRARRVVWQVPR